MDAIELALFASRTQAVCDEMGMVLRRSAFSPNIKDRLDFSCALFDPAGALFAQAAHIPVHLGSMAFAMADVVAQIDWRPGDVVMFNDPFLGGTHLPDVTVVEPVWLDEALIAFAATRAHHADIGSATPGSMPLSTRLEEEGVIIAPMLLLRGGRVPPAAAAVLGRLAGVNPEALRRAGATCALSGGSSGESSGDGSGDGSGNKPGDGLGYGAPGGAGDGDGDAGGEGGGEAPADGRVDGRNGDWQSRPALADFAAQASSAALGARALASLARTMGGADAFAGGLRELDGWAERASRDALTALPRGVWTAQDLLDDDGQGAEDLRIAVTVTVSAPAGDGPFVEVDFAGTAPQMRGNLNCPLAVAAAGVLYVFRCLMPGGVPACAGSFRPISIRAPDGCLLNAARPAAVAAGNVETSMRVVDVLLRALAPALPERIPAAAQGTMNNVAMGARSSVARGTGSDDATDLRQHDAAGARHDDAPGSRGNEAAGVRGNDATGVRGNEATDSPGSEATGVRGNDATGTRCDGATGVQGKEATGVRGSRDWDYYETLAGGLGAHAAGAGPSAMHAHMTNTLNTPIESLEAHYPLRVERYALRRDSGGAGRHRGGDGIERSYRFLEDAEVTLLGERRRHAPWGLAGGGSGAVGEDELDGVRVAGKSRHRVRAGSLLTIRTPGGGGWGRAGD